LPRRGGTGKRKEISCRKKKGGRQCRAGLEGGRESTRFIFVRRGRSGKREEILAIFPLQLAGEGRERALCQIVTTTGQKKGEEEEEKFVLGGKKKNGR